MSNTADTYGRPAGGFMEAFIDIELALVLFGIAIIVASFGAIIGHLTKNMIILVSILVAVGMFLQFHIYLPFPPEVHAEIMALKARLWPF